MDLAVPGSSGSLAISVGNNSGAIVVGDYNIVHLQVPAEPTITPREPAVEDRPQTPEGFLDRRIETGTLQAALSRSKLVEVSGVQRVGKSWFLQQAGDKAGAQYTDGALLLPPGLKGPGDVLHALFELFYDTAPAAKLTIAELHKKLSQKKALIVVDDIALTPSEWSQVLYGATGCRVLLASEKAAAGPDSEPIALAGLPLDDAMALAERVHGGPLSGVLYMRLLESCRAVNGHPQQVIDAVRALGSQTLAGAFSAAPASNSDERAVLDTVQAYAPHAVPLPCLSELSGVPDAQRHVAALVAGGWLQRDGDSILPGPAARGPVPVASDGEGAAARRIQGLVRLGQMARANPKRRWQALKALPLLWFGLAQSAAAGHHADVLALGQAWHVPLTLSGLWDGWRELLAHHLAAARALGDAGAQAWALHQSGTRELALGQTAAALGLFREAIQIELRIGDAALQAATQYHLDQIAALPPPPPAPTPAPAPVAPRGMGRGLQAAGGAVIVGASGLAWFASAPALEWEPPTLDFGSIDVASPARTKQLLLRNRGWRSLTLGSPRLEGEGAASFTVDAACAGRVLAHGDTCSVQISFKPDAPGVARAALAFRQPDQRADAAGTRVALAGRARPHDADLKGPTADPVQLPVTPSPPAPTPPPPPPPPLDPPVLDFGAQEVGQSSAPKAVHVTNPGAGPLKFTQLAVVPAYAPFTLDAGSCRAATLAPGQSCDLRVSFAPRAGQRGPREGQLRLTPLAGQPLLVALSGQGAAAEVQLRPAVLDFGSQNWPVLAGPGAAGRAARTVVVSNRGDAPLRLAGVRAGGATVADFPYTQNCPAVLEPGARCELKVRYRPQAAHSSDAYLTLDAPAAEGALRLPLLARAVDNAAVVPVLLAPKDGAVVFCSSNDSWQVEFRWSAPPETAAGALRYEVVLESAAPLSVGSATRRTLRVNCPARLRWRVEAIAANEQRGVSAWRELITVKSNPPAPSPGPTPTPTPPAPPAPNPPAPSPAVGRP